MINLDQEDLIGLFIDRMKPFTTKKRKGIYNRQDPTQIEVWEGECYLEQGFVIVDEWAEDEEGKVALNKEGKPFFLGSYPMPEKVSFKIMDVTWGIEFTLKSSLGTDSAYFDSSSKEWTRPTDNFFRVIQAIFLRAEKVSIYECSCGSTEFRWESGFPGERIKFCAECGEAADSMTVMSEIE